MHLPEYHRKQIDWKFGRKKCLWRSKKTPSIPSRKPTMHMGRRSNGFLGNCRNTELGIRSGTINDNDCPCKYPNETGMTFGSDNRTRTRTTCRATGGYTLFSYFATSRRTTNVPMAVDSSSLFAVCRSDRHLACPVQNPL
jgi:hypothetical protein